MIVGSVYFPISAESTEQEQVITLQNGEFASLLSAQNVLDDYFAFRSSSFTMPDTRAAVFSKADNEIIADEAKRVDGIKAMEERDGIHVVETVVTQDIVDASMTSDGMIKALVDEWTVLKYNYDGSDTATDELGFGTKHEILLNSDDAGSYTIIQDAYKEGPASNMISSSYNTSSLAEIERQIEEELQEDIENAAAMASEYEAEGYTLGEPRGTVSGYSPLKAATYANKWVKKAQNSGGPNTQYYNTAKYGYCQSDCANYVSQCLAEGGLKMSRQDNSLSNKKNWFANTPMTASNIATKSTVTWRGSESLFTYLGYNYTTLEANKSTVKQGNPVHTTGHVTICVGVNSDGVPIVNSHTNDMYHVPYTWTSASGGNLRTVMLQY